MKHIIYLYSRKNPLTARLTAQIESRVSILYPSTKYSIIQRTAEYLIRIYFIALLVIVGLLYFAEFSIYYAMLSLMMVYAVINTIVYEELEKLELKLLGQLEKFVSDVRFRYQFDGMLEEAIQEAINLAEYEMSIQGERILECLKRQFNLELDDYSEIAPNHFFLTFYSICVMNMKYGDKKIEETSVFIRNLAYLKEDINVEQLKRRKIANQFMGLYGLTLLPVFAIKPIEKWAVSNMPDMEKVYSGLQGIGVTIFLMIFTISVYKIISILKRANHHVQSKNPFIYRLANTQFCRKLVYWYIVIRKKQAERCNQLLKDVVYIYDFGEFMILRWISAIGYGVFCGIIGGSVGGNGFVLTGIMCCGCVVGYFSCYVSIVFKRQILIMEREEEIVRFQTIILMLMHIDRMTIAELLEQMERYAVTFRNEIYELANTLSYKGIGVFREAKGRTSFHPYEKLLDSFRSCDIMPINMAFGDAETDRLYYVEKHKQDNESIIERKSLIAKTIAFLPLCLVILLKLIVPFVVQGISSLSMNMMM